MCAAIDDLFPRRAKADDPEFSITYAQIEAEAMGIVNAMLNHDELRLLAIHRLMDGVGDIDLHELAADLATKRGHEEPTDRDYLDATREALDVIVKAEFRILNFARHPTCGKQCQRERKGRERCTDFCEWLPQKCSE